HPQPAAAGQRGQRGRADQPRGPDEDHSPAAALTKSFTEAAPLGEREAAMKARLFSEVSLRSLYLGGGRLVAGPLIALFLLVTHHTLSHVELVERVDLAQVVEGSRGEEQDVGDQI